MALVLAFAGVAAAGEKTYINGIDANYPPFAYIDNNGKPAGFDVESMNWIANKMGFKVVHQPMDWDGIIPSLVAKKIDMVCSGMTISPERAAKVTFTEPYWSVEQVFVVKKGSDLTPEALRTQEKRVGVQRGTSEADDLQKQVTDRGYNFDLRFYDSAPMAVEDVLNGRIDAACMDSLPAGDAVSKKPVQIAGVCGSSISNFGVATRNEDAELRAIINEGHRLLKADPIWVELQKKYIK